MRNRVLLVCLFFFVISLTFVKFTFSQEDIVFKAPEFDQESGLLKDIAALKGEDSTALIPNTDPSGMDDGTAIDETGNPYVSTSQS